MESTRKPGGLEKFQVTDREECGVIIERHDEGEPKLCYVVKVPNRSENPSDYVIMSSDVGNVQNVLSESERIVGFMHTHLEHHKCEPSDTDIDGAALFPEMENLIYQPSTKKFCWYGPEVTT